MGAVTVPLLRSSSGLDVDHLSRLIRPPGSLAEKEFLERCTRCGECRKVCPNNAIQPTLFEAGLEGYHLDIAPTKDEDGEPAELPDPERVTIDTLADDKQGITRCAKLRTVDYEMLLFK